MAPTFIKEVSAPEVHRIIETLVKVWNRKCELAQGRPFEAHADIRYAALDAIFASSFGLLEEDSITVRRLNAVATCEPDIPQSRDEPLSFPEGEIPDIFSAVLTLANSVTDTQLSPFPVLTSWILRKLPYMRRATATKDAYIHSKVQECVQLIDRGDAKPKIALHSVLLREREVARKDSREPQYSKRAVADEFFGFMLAGHDTTATAVSWGVKYLTDNPAAQSKLRDALHSGYPDAVKEMREPNYQELYKASIPYLDATVEEILRHANTIAFIVRQALQDTTVLGHRVPRGTDVFLMANGAGYLEPNMPLTPYDTRSPGAQPSQAKSLTGLWDDSDIQVFKPERWLIVDGVFNPMAGPQLAFGLGHRGCFGKRLALQALRMQFALLVWEFRFEGVTEECGGYGSVQRFAREPRKCYVRLGKVKGQDTGKVE
jgi:cytochrome P450